MSLQEYKRKRHFDRTPEPTGRTADRSGHLFVIQKHAASHLHYDFRLELDGVLKSWAVPKGPSLDPAVKRLAMQVEDHPIEYGSFEGIIPQGEYGGGTVMLWDRGSWEPMEAARESYRSGRLKFRLSGHKLRGQWMLVKTGSEKGRNRWLLFKEKDDEARPGSKDKLLESPSVTTGRSLEEIAADQDRVWDSTGERRSTAAKVKQSPKPAAKYDARNERFAGVRLTSPDKLLYPDDGITKLELAQYYRDVAKWMLPHVRHRPLVLMRCPEGRHKECFFQKHPGVGTPETLRQIPVRESSATRNYLIADDAAGLISLAQIGALEIHVWGSREDKLEQPDRLIFDLDPDEALPWKRVTAGALQVRDFLSKLGLRCFVKTTGGKGLHLVVPIVRRLEWDDVKAFCKKVADLVVTADPAHFTANMSKAARPGKIFIDYLRNGRGATAVAAYSTRAKAGAPVSTPIDWKELDDLGGANAFTIRNIGRRLGKLKRDPWADIGSTRQGLAKPLRAIERLG
ncbi:MAG TPA: non-homologous end-joining DNA ligase [Gemmataceae bacterium]